MAIDIPQQALIEPSDQNILKSLLCPGSIVKVFYGGNFPLPLLDYQKPPPYPVSGSSSDISFTLACVIHPPMLSSSQTKQSENTITVFDGLKDFDIEFDSVFVGNMESSLNLSNTSRRKSHMRILSLTPSILLSLFSSFQR